MAYVNPKMSSLFGSGACASREPSAAEGWADALNNPAYVRNFDVAKPARELASGGESEENTLTEAMAAAQISTGPAVSTTTSEQVRTLLPRPRPPRLVIFQRGAPQALAMYQGPPPTPAWNVNELAEHFIYEGEARPASAPPQTMEGDVEEEEENLVQVDAVSEDDEEEMAESRSMPGWQNPRTKRRARQVLDLLDQEVLDAMSTDNLIWIMQAGFQSLVTRRVRH